MGGGGGAGKANFSDIVAETRSGAATLALLQAVTTGKQFSRVELSGCERPAACGSTTVLKRVIVTELVLGSLTLFDQTQFNYATIQWDRGDTASTRPSEVTSFYWDVAENHGG